MTKHQLLSTPWLLQMPKVERNTDTEPSKVVLRDSQQTKSLGELAVIVYNKTYLEALPASKWNLACRYNSTCWQFQFLKLQASWTCCGRHFLDDCWLVASSQDWVKYELKTISARCSCHSLSNFISFLPQASWALTHELFSFYISQFTCLFSMQMEGKITTWNQLQIFASLKFKN